MSSVSSTELPCWENKDFDSWFAPADLEHSHPTSFFDLGFDYNEDAFESSDTSAEYNFFDEIDLGSTSTEASAFSTTIDGASNGNSRFRTLPNKSPRRAPIVPEAPVPTSQRLVHRLRPEGVAISSADLLSIEGRRQNPLTDLFRPKTPPPTPQHRFGWNTPKTPRTPKERGSKVQKGTGSMRSPKKAMQPSNYYDPDTPSMPDWSDRFQRFSLQQNTLPISPPVSTRIGYNTQPARLNTSHHHVNSLAGSPTPKRETTTRRMSSSSPTRMDHPIVQSIEHDSNQISPLAPWASDNANMSFSPVSPMLEEDPWGSNALAHLNNSQFDPYPSANPSEPANQALAGTGGLLIDFGDSGNGLNPGLNDIFPEQYSLEDPSSMTIAPALNLHDPHQHPSRSDSLDSTGSYAHSFTSRSPTPSPKTSHPYPYPYPKSQSMRSKRSAPAHRKGTSKDISLDRAGTALTHKRTGSKNGTIGKSGVGKRTGGGQALGGMFVNFTPSDSRRILGGVAPSGSSKTKARREKEARDERRKMSEAAKRAVQEAGGNWESLVEGQLVEV